MVSPARPSSDGFVAWIEGLPCAGKTTVARSVADWVRNSGRRAEVLDGDEVRHVLDPELGFSRKDRDAHARRVSYVAGLLARNDVAVMVALITPYESSRQAVRATLGNRFTEVWLRCPVEVCRQRDAKGLYRGSAAPGTKLTGVDDPFEEPLNPDLIVDTGAYSVDTATRKVVDHLVERGFLSRTIPF